MPPFFNFNLVLPKTPTKTMTGRHLAYFQRASMLTLNLTLAVLLFAMMWVTLIDVVGRYLFNSPLPGGFELTQVMMGLLVFVALPLITVRDEQICITILERYFVGVTGISQKMFVLLVSIFALVVLTWQLWIQAEKLAEAGTVTMFLKLPVYYFVGAMSLTSALATILLLIIGPKSRQATEREVAEPK